MHIPRNKKLTERAVKLRNEMTPQERKLWFLFLKNHEPKFYAQRIIGSFIVDFYCAKAKLVIEIDGSQHFEEQGMAYDRERTEYLESLGLRVQRFTNREIDQDFTSVCNKILSDLAQALEATAH